MHKLVLIDMEEMTTDDWVTLAVSKRSNVPSAMLVHGDIACDGIRLHNGDSFGTRRCSCGDKIFHEKLDNLIKDADKAKLVFRLNRQYLLDALSGLDENTYISFYCDGLNKPVLISDGERSAIVMPIGEQPA